jgi:hypothetical protein
MKTIEEELGKVSLTCNGQWNDRPYERLCIVHDGFYAIYLVKLFLPVFLYLMKSIGNLLLNFEKI